MWTNENIPNDNPKFVVILFSIIYYGQNSKMLGLLTKRTKAMCDNVL